MAALSNKVELMPDDWEERVRTYTTQRGLGNDYTIIDWSVLGGSYLIAYPGCYGLYVFSLYGHFPSEKKRKYLTLFCVEITKPTNDWPDTEYIYLFQFLSSSIFSSVFDLKKIYSYVKERRYATVLGGTVTDEQWEVIKAHYDYTCLCCGKREPEIKLTVDHIVPRSKGGTSILSNIQPLCKPCNAAKRDKIIDYRKR